MTYRTTRQCDQDVIDIYVHGTVNFGIDQAERSHVSLAKTFELLAPNPHIAHKRDEFIPPVRLHRHHVHMIAYVEHGESILILRVLHGRQNWERYLA